MAEILYAAYGPGGVACLIECLTDNRNRTIANIRSIAGKNGGNFADTNAVAWMFERKGVVVARKQQDAGVGESHGFRLRDDMELHLIEIGAEDIDTDGDTVTVTTSQNNWVEVRNFLKENGFDVLEAGLKYRAKERVKIADTAVAEKIRTFVEALEADDDVTEVFTNAKFLVAV